MKRYMFFWLALTGFSLVAVAVFNLLVDPYGLFRIVDKPGFNKLKPKAGAHGPMVKAYNVIRVQPRGLIVGNSRAEVGFDPEHVDWPAKAKPVFNLALPGTGTSTTVQYLKHVLVNADNSAVSKPTVIVWGLDFMDFLVDADAPQQAKVARPDLRLFVTPSRWSSPQYLFQQLRDVAEATFTADAFLDSMRTIGSKNDPYAADLTLLGFNPMHDYLKITADEGYWAVFRQKDIENIKAYLKRPRGIFEAGRQTSGPLDDLREVLQLCRENGIDLHLLIYPYHARLLEIINITGHWPAFEAWKRAIVQAVDTEARTSGMKPVALWDFSMLSQWTTEVVPAMDDRQGRMRWYWEAGHFKRELGDKVLQRIFEPKASDNAFGLLLLPENVESNIAAMRVMAADYRRSNARDIEALNKFALDIMLQKRKQ